MKRRDFVFTATTFAFLGGCGVLPNLGKPATPAVAHVGILAGAPSPPSSEFEIITGLKQGLIQLGYVDGKSITFEERNAGTPELASELVRLPVQVLVTTLTGQTLNARQITTTTPIVFVAVTDPVGQGIVASLAHPGGNVTGVTNQPATAFGKQLEFLTQLVPGLTRVGIVTDISNPGGRLQLQGATTSAEALGVQVKPLEVRSLEDVDIVLSDALAWHAGALIINSANAVISGAVGHFLDFQTRDGVPMTFGAKGQVQAGGLMSYGASFIGMGSTAAAYVDRIIKGAKPSDLPVEEPTTFELIVNQTTAQTLGITIPPEVAQQVTQWVQ